MLKVVLYHRQRHRQSMRTAHDALVRALNHDFQKEPELAAEDFRLAAVAVGRITGEIDVEELLENIFSAFVLENKQKAVITMQILALCAIECV